MNLVNIFYIYKLWLILRILSKLDHGDKLRCCGVCSAWRAWCVDLTGDEVHAQESEYVVYDDTCKEAGAIAEVQSFKNMSFSDLYSTHRQEPSKPI